MEQYKSNSHKSKAEARNNEKRVEKVVKGKVKTKHKKGIRRGMYKNRCISSRNRG